VTAVSECARAELVAAELLAPIASGLDPDVYGPLRDLLALAFLKGARYGLEAWLEVNAS
jgi:hypothetical protein